MRELLGAGPLDHPRRCPQLTNNPPGPPPTHPPPPRPARQVRTLETLIRLSCAHAKVRLSPYVEKGDVEEVAALMDLIMKSDPSAQQARAAGGGRCGGGKLGEEGGLGAGRFGEE